MTTKEQLDEAKRLLKEQEEQDKLTIEFQAVEAKLDAYRKKKPPNDIGGQMRWILEQYGLRTTFYCFIFGMTIILIGLLTPYSLVAPIPGGLTFFSLGPVALFGYGIYKIPFVNEFLKDEIESKTSKSRSKK